MNAKQIEMAESKVNIVTEESISCPHTKVQKSTNVTPKIMKPISNKRKTHHPSQTNLATHENENNLEEATTKRLKTDENSTTETTSKEINNKVLTKPPLPPTISTYTKSRMKKVKDEAYAALVQKLTAHAEQLRMEIVKLKSALTNEKLAFRSLRYVFNKIVTQI